MRPRSALWDRTVTQPHTIITTASILDGGVTIVEGLAVRSGQVVQNRAQLALSTCTVVLAEPALLPTITAGGILSPYGYEIAIKSGIAYPDGTIEQMALGVFPIQDANINGATLETSITAVDRTATVTDSMFTDDWPITSGALYTQAIQDILTSQVPQFPKLIFPPTLLYTVPTSGLVYMVNTDPMIAINQMAKACGCQFYFDGLGVPTLLATSCNSSEP